jgi:signal recognition particle GTPase
MKITINQLQEMITEAITAKLSESPLTEGVKEIPIRMILGDIKDVIVGSITEDLTRELRMDEHAIEGVVSRAFDKMVREIVMELDKPGMDVGSGPRRRVVAVGA